MISWMALEYWVMSYSQYKSARLVLGCCGHYGHDACNSVCNVIVSVWWVIYAVFGAGCFALQRHKLVNQSGVIQQRNCLRINNRQKILIEIALWRCRLVISNSILADLLFRPISRVSITNNL